MKISKKVLSILLCTVMILGSLAVGGEGFIDALDLLSVKASAAQCGIFTYEVTDGKVTIIGCDSSASGEITIPSTLDGYPVTSIGDFAFGYCTDLTSVIIPGSVTSIGTRAFSTCFSLTSVTIGSGVTSIGENAFSDCRNLTSINIPDGVISIGDNAFYYCTGLTSVKIGSGVTSIGDNAFSDCIGLTSINIPDGVTSIGNNAFSDCIGLTSINIPDGVTSIGDCAFFGCADLTSIYIPDSVTSIGDKAFYGVLNIAYSENMKAGRSAWGAKFVNGYVEGYFVYSDSAKKALAGCSSSAAGNVIIPEGVTSIGDYAFKQCTNLTSINIPDGVISIGKNTFEGCAGLTSINIPDGVISIGDYAFKQCTNLTSVNIPDSVTSIGENAFFECKNLTNIIIPGNVTSIGENAFFSCHNLTNIIIPGNVTSIGKSAFDRCTGLKSINIPGSVASIMNGTFYGCSGLTTVTIGSGVTRIDDNAFSSCTGLTSIYIPDSVTSIGYSAFDACSYLKDVYYGGTEQQKTEIAFDKYNDSLINASWHYSHIHSYTESVTKTVTCTENGLMTFACVCGDKYTEVIPARHTDMDGNGKCDDCRTVFDEALFNATVGSGKCGDNAYWRLDNEGTLTISGTGKTKSSDWYSIKDNIKNVRIGDDITYVHNGAFNNCLYLKNVTLGSGITAIDSLTFQMCVNLNSIYIPAGVTDIYDTAFYMCPIKDVYYGGTEQQKANIHISFNGNDAFANANNITWHYSHVHSYTETVTKTVTCTENGLMTYACECGDTYTKIIHACHDYVDHEAKAPTCEEIGWEAYQTCKRCDYTSYKEIPPLGHDYNITYTWSADGKTCTAAATCKKNANHVVTENATITSAVKEEPTCEKKGTATYTASFTNELFSTQTKDVEDIDALGHDYVNHEAKAPNCEEIGWDAYQTCKRCDYTSYKEILPLGHDYAVTYEWSADGKTCTATATCKNHANHVLFECPVSVCNVKEQPTCDRKGISTYTATFESNIFSTQTNDVEDIPALGHDYDITYTWSADGKSCSAEAVCKNDANHIVKENAAVTSAVKVQPTCEEKGTATYTASFTHEPFTAQTKDVKEIPPTGHTDEDNDGICDVCREIINAEANKAFLESKIALNIPGEATVRFRNKAAVTVTADNLPEGYTIAIYDGDTLLAKSKPGEDSVTYTTGELQKAVTLTVKALDKDGNAVTGKTGEIKVNVNKNIFTIVIALILGIFRKLPTVTVKP